MAERLTFLCPTCRARMQLLVLAKHNVPGDDGEQVIQHFFGHCAGCNGVGLCTRQRTGPDEWEYDEQQAYPIATKPIDFALPEEVERSWREALTCASAGAWLATAVMVRRTLEAIGREFDPNSKRGLFEGLKSMKERGAISEELLQWGDQLRFLGNIGAHPTADAVTPEDGRDALEFLNAIAETIYHLRPKFQAMNKRRVERTRKTEGAEGKVDTKTRAPATPDG